jgi:hypothetical protein
MGHVAGSGRTRTGAVSRPFTQRLQQLALLRFGFLAHIAVGDLPAPARTAPEEIVRDATGSGTTSAGQWRQATLDGSLPRALTCKPSSSSTSPTCSCPDCCKHDAWRNNTGRSPMDLGLHYWNFSTPADPQRIADTLALAAKTAERAGFAEFNVMDHYFQIEQRGTADEPMLEGLHQGVIQDSRIGDCDPRVR